MNTKRLFFGIEIHAPWPSPLPNGRIIHESFRHLTLAFLGNIDYDLLAPLLSDIPHYPFSVGLVGKFDRSLPLPPNRPNVISWHVSFFEQYLSLLEYRKELIEFLQDHEIHPQIHKGDFLPHVSITRRPFEPSEWEKAFSSLPMYATHLNLYESLGNLHYKPIWSQKVLAPFEVIENSTGTCLRVRGSDPYQLFLHAFTALSFTDPQLIDLFEEVSLDSIEEIENKLNEIISNGKIRFREDVEEKHEYFLEWERLNHGDTL